MCSMSISSLLRGRTLRCNNCGLLCRIFAMYSEGAACPRCGARGLVAASTRMTDADVEHATRTGSR